MIIFTLQVLFPQDYMAHPKFIRLRKSLRPIVSSINSYNYNLANYLYELLTSFIPSAHCTQDSFTFIKDIQKVSMQDSFMLSYDVCNLFTNIPLSETIDIA